MEAEKANVFEGLLPARKQLRGNLSRCSSLVQLLNLGLQNCACIQFDKTEVSNYRRIELVDSCHGGGERLREGPGRIPRKVRC